MVPMILQVCPSNPAVTPFAVDPHTRPRTLSAFLFPSAPGQRGKAVGLGNLRHGDGDFCRTLGLPCPCGIEVRQGAPAAVAGQSSTARAPSFGGSPGLGIGP